MIAVLLFVRFLLSFVALSQLSKLPSGLPAVTLIDHFVKWIIILGGFVMSYHFILPAVAEWAKIQVSLYREGEE